jgi:uncharacterized radical SAM superfamily protein
MKPQRLTLEEKKDLVGKVDDLAKNEKISVKEACKRLDMPYWKYFNALKVIKSSKKKVKVGARVGVKVGAKTGKKVAAKAEAKPEARTLPIVYTNGELKVELVFKGDTAKLVKGYALAYDVEPEVVCRIMVIDALNDKR